jgi:hypothetical protein
MSFLERVTGILTSPTPTFRSMLEAKVGLIEPIIIVFLASLSSGIATVLVIRRPAIPVPPGMSMPAFDPAISIASSIVGGILIWLIGGLFLYAIARLLGGQGTFEQTLLVIGYAEVPAIYSIILGIMGWATSPIVYWMFSLLLSIWTFVLSVLGLREAHRFSTLRALAVFLIPIIAIGIIIAAVIVILLTLIAPWIIPVVP